MRGRFASYILGWGLLGLAAMNLIFLVYAVLLKEPWWGFVAAALLAATVGLPLRLFGSQEARPSRRETLVGISLFWILVTSIGSLPYAMNAGLSWVNALFESSSGFTATGATIIDNFEHIPASLFMYRAFSQWLGGIGIIVVFIVILPQLAIAGRQLFFAEMTGPTEDKLTPKIRQTALAIGGVYLSLTSLCFLAYRLAGMSWYDGLAHTFTTVSAAGFSPRADSFVSYSATVEWVATVFMILAGVSFALYVNAFSGRLRYVWRDYELRAYLVIIGISTLLITLVLSETQSVSEALRHSMFQAVSILTTTGYASVDYNQWSERAQGILVALMFIGGSAGSAAGGIKIARWIIINQTTMREIRRVLHPRAIIPLRIGNRTIPEDVLRAVAAFITIFASIVAFNTLLLVWLGTDFVTAFTAALACVSNVGPGLAGIGPMENYSNLHPLSRILLSLSMIAGRLEIMTLFVAFDRRFWRLPRWRRS